MSLFEPNPVVLTFLFVKTTGYLSLLMFLALLRGGLARGPARLWALAALGLALAGLAAQVGPALLGIYSGAPMRVAFAYRSAADGFAPLLLASAPLIVSGLVRGRRLWPVDALHALLIAGTALLWLLTR